jgi:hypothetical protein
VASLPDCSRSSQMQILHELKYIDHHAGQG